MSYRFKRMGVTICRATKLLRVTKWSHDDVCYTMVTRKKKKKIKLLRRPQFACSMALMHSLTGSCFAMAAMSAS